MAPSAVDIATSTLVALFVESVLYGMFVLLFALAMSVLLGKRRANKRGRSGGRTMPMIVASVVMFILSTIHIAIDLKRAMQGFLYGVNIAPVSTASYLLKSTAYAMQTIVGDAFMIYRVYLVWDGDKRVYLPLVLLLCGGITAGAGALQAFAATKHATTGNPIFLINLHNWIVSFFSITLVTNATSTLLIAARIWLIDRSTGNTAKVFGRRLGPAILIIVESGAIYSVALVILLALYVNNSYAQYILLDAEVQIVGVVFTMIIVRVGMGLGAAPGETTRNTNASTHGSASGARLGGGFRSATSGQRIQTTTLELSPTQIRGGVSVTTTQEVKTDADYTSGWVIDKQDHAADGANWARGDV
ncbi:hypothetical protein HMN09_00132700 [Mycena chlorophos]|uniref:Uncharacterized protein n=1 Tax=Mycena chlorophos TaxID=658473 RepID=A0A8H6WK89_MYCCL|nr:hypothetical protein HMN09_00132700 [Mycena chlorophos]